MKKKWLSTLLLAGLLINVPYVYAEEAAETENVQQAVLTEDTVPTETTHEETVSTEASVADEAAAESEAESTQVPEVSVPTESLSSDTANQVVLTLNQTNAMVYGEEVTLLTPPKVVNGTTLLPFRFAVEQVIGGSLKWEQETQTITINKDDTEVMVVVGQKTAYVDGLEVELETPAIVENGTTLLPLRFISEAFGLPISYNPEEKTITLTKPVDTTPNTAPIAAFSFPQDYTAGQTVSVVNSSYDPDGDYIKNQLWSVTSDTTTTNSDLSKIFSKPKAGTYIIGLQVQDSKGKWSDWTYQTVTIAENKAPVITSFEVAKSSYAQGEALDFSYNWDNEEWENVTAGKWTYRSVSEDASKATLGKPDVIFEEGDYVVTLWLDDTYGNRSEAVSTTVHITNEVKMSELTYRFNTGTLGAWIDNFAGVNYLNYKDAFIAGTAYDKGTLIMSDSPEIVSGQGILYKDIIDGTGRLLIHHISNISDLAANGEKQRLAVIAQNTTEEPITITLKNKAIKGPVADVLRAGQVSLFEYLTGTAEETLTLKPGESQYIYDKTWLINQAISGHVDVETSGPITFVVAALNQSHTLDQINDLVYYPADGAHYSGTYDTVGIHYNVLLDGSEPEKLIIGKVNNGEWVVGYDERDQSYVENAGNFGVSYYVTVTATEDTGVILNNRGGTFKGAIKWNDTVYNVPIEGSFSGTTTKAVVLGTIKAGETVTIEYILPNGSAAPTLIGFIPKSCW